jgi:hypothetical protein
MEQARLRWANAGEPEQCAQLLDVGCGEVLVLSCTSVPFLNSDCGKSAEFHGLLSEQLGNHDLSGAPDTEGEDLGLIGLAGGPQIAIIQAPADVNRQRLSSLQDKLQALFSHD